MKLKDILVHLDGSAHSDVRLQAAVRLAAAHGAHLIGLHVAEVMSPVALAGGGVERDFYDLSLTEWRREVAAEVATTRDSFEKALSSEALSGEWCAVEGTVAEVTAAHANCADITILAQHTEERFNLGTVRWLVEQVLLTSGRPVLLLPEAGRPATFGPGTRVLIGWDGSRAAVRAVHDALPLLRQAAAVTILSIGTDAEDHAAIPLTPATDLAPHLARHGVQVEAAHAPQHARNPADILLEHAANDGSDLLVTGGFGHSRLREFVLGGATREVLAAAKIPVLLAH
jgi:nucleotide-binding universal stress UspA family protein